MRMNFVTAVAVAALASSVTSQGANWMELAHPSSPPARDTHGFTYEPVTQHIVLFGGFQSATWSQLNDTWEWDGANWLQANPTTPPSPRETFAMCADGNGSVILFGGKAFGAGGGTLDETWRYTQGQWTRLQPSNHPSARRYVSMTRTTQGLFLFGGWGSAGYLGDAWLWNGSDWQSVSAAGGPSPRRGCALTYDPLRDVVVLFGGQGSNGLLADMWEWSPAGGWQAKMPSVQPSARTSSAMAFSTALGGCVLFGGETFANNAETWLWDGSTWTMLVTATQPPARRAHAMTTFEPTGEAVVSGGRGNTSLGDTWFLSTSSASFQTFGTGCADPTGTVPTLAGAPGSEPRLGSMSTMQVQSLPPSITVPVFVYGLSKTVDPGPPAYSLPADLGVLGWPGCQQLISDDAHNLTITNSATITHTISVPPDLGLIGFEYHVQAFVLYTSSDLAVTNGVTATVGF